MNPTPAFWVVAGSLVAVVAAANLDNPKDPAPIAAASYSESAHDRTVLVAIYHATGGSGWRRQEGWLTARPMGTWDGVTVENGHVTRLELKNNRLRGALPPEIGTLTHLRHLALPGNNLIGPIPGEIGNLSVLFHLDLRWNALEGDIPHELTRLPGIGSLLLSANRLSGPVPRAFSELSLLTRIDLSHNQLSGGIPPEIGSLRFLRSLGLSDNRLQGVIPSELGELSRVERVLLQSNELTGSIPGSLATLPKLTHLNLADNRMSGHLPPLARLAGLEWHRLGGNQFAGPLPEPTGRQTAGRADSSDGDTGSDKDGAARPGTGGFLNGLDAWTATTSEVSDDPFHHLVRQTLSAVTVVSGYAAVDHSRVPDWLSFEDAEMVVKLVNDFLHSAGFIIEDAYDLLRVVETYEGPTLDLTPLLHPNGSSDVDGLPQRLSRPRPRTEDDHTGLLQMPARLDKEQYGDRLGDPPYRPNETVGLVRCSGRLGASRRSGVNGLIYAEADVNCDLEKLVPNCPPVDWTLNLTLARHESSFFGSQWIEVAWKNDLSPAAYSTSWTDARVESSIARTATSRHVGAGTMSLRGRSRHTAHPIHSVRRPPPSPAARSNRATARSTPTTA